MSVEEINVLVLKKIEQFVSKHIVTRYFLNKSLLEHARDEVNLFKEYGALTGNLKNAFALDYSTRIDAPRETRTYFKSLIQTYGDPIVENALKIYFKKHFEEINEPDNSCVQTDVTKKPQTALSPDLSQCTPGSANVAVCPDTKSTQVKGIRTNGQGDISENTSVHKENIKEGQ